MNTELKNKLLACKSYNDAKPILETQKAGVAVHKLFNTAFSIQAKQPMVATDFMNTAIQEMEDDEEDHKKIQEYDGGSSEQSSSQTGLEKEGTEHDAPESASAQPDKKDQMGVAINENMPYPPQQQQPQQMMPPQGGQCGGGQQPPQGMPPQQQQMQYTISEIQRIGGMMNKMQEAIKTLDKKIQETQRQEVKSLDLGPSLGAKKVLPSIKETTGDKTVDLHATRNEITRMNDLINSGKF